MSPLSHSLSTFPNFARYLGMAFGLTALYTIIYTAITPYSEWKLLRRGNTAASLAFGGSLLGFVLPLASAIAHAESLFDCTVWGVVALVVQLIIFFLLRCLLPDLARHIEEDKKGPATALALLSLAAGILNAACMTW